MNMIKNNINDINVERFTDIYEGGKRMQECKTCYGYGFWAIGHHCPMGSMDASDNYPTLPCPECGANPNPDE